jgi:hypothetical protein
MSSCEERARIEYATGGVRERTAHIEHWTAWIQFLTALVNLTARSVGVWAMVGGLALAFLLRVLG